MKFKTLLIAAFFIICLILVVWFKQFAGGSYRINQVDFYESTNEWADFQLINMSADAAGNYLLIDDPTKPGLLISPPHKTKFSFDEIILSWNCRVEDDGIVYITISLSPDSSSWYDFNYQTWGDIDRNKLEVPWLESSIKGIGYLDEDIIRLKKPMKYYRFAIHTFAGKGGWLLFDRATVCYSKTNGSLRDLKRFAPVEYEITPVNLAVPYKSQGWLPDSISGKTCSPTSVGMVLNYYNLDYSTIEVAGAVYDKYNYIYGNWPYNAQAAYILGMNRAWIGRHNSFNELAGELADGKPVVISIAIDDNQKLTGAPYKTTEGHLIVVRGFDQNGNVLINDPAADDIEQGMVTYDINELTDVWVGHDGIAYHLWR